MTKVKILLVLFVMCKITLNAQCKDCFPKENDWKFAAGVTLYSNNHYVSDVNILERQPLEFNFKYKLKDRHLLRFSVPLLLKTNKHGEPQVTSPEYPTKEVTLEDYLQTLHNKDFTYAYYTKTLHYYETLMGISAGYEYNLPIGNSFSLLAGLNLSYYNLAVLSKFYSIDYYELDAENKSKIGLIGLWNKEINGFGYAVNPMLGVNYKFQKLLLEANIGYVFTKVDYNIKLDLSTIEGISGIKRNVSDEGKGTPQVFNNLLYKITLYYTF